MLPLTVLVLWLFARQVMYWRRSGTPYVVLTYSGQDTGNSKWIVPSDR